MSLARFYVHDVTILEPATDADRYGDTVDDWATATETAAKGWLVQTSTDEGTVDNRTPVTSRWKLYLPATAEITSRSRVRSAGVTYEVIGDPVVAAAPRGPHHIETDLRVVKG